MSRLPVSVVVLNWNRKALTEQCLRGLQQQVLLPQEVIVVDNGSTDGSAEYLSTRFPEVALLALSENLGFCGGNNAGIRRAGGDYIALLNNDAEADPRWLEALVRALEARPDVGFCASKILLHDRPDLLDTAGDGYTIAGSGFKRGHLDGADDPAYNRPAEVFSACAGAALYRRAMLDDVGLFDEDFFISQEDVDLCFRAQLRGYKGLYVPTAVVRHHLNATLKTYSRTYVYYGHRNLEYVYVKNLPLPWLLLLLPLHALDVLLTFSFFLAIGRGGTCLRAKRDACRALPRLLKKRRAIQRARRVHWSRVSAWLEWRWPLPKLGVLRRRLRRRLRGAGGRKRP